MCDDGPARLVNFSTPGDTHQSVVLSARLAIARGQAQRMQVTEPGFEILLEDGPCLVVLKPGGVLTQAPPGIDSLELRIKRFLRERNSDAQSPYLGVVHRLDRPVSGAMVFATAAKATRRISAQFEGRLVDKKYWAVVEGIVEPDAGTWTDYVRKVPGEARAEIADQDQKDGRIAVLHYSVKRRMGMRTWLEIKLETGRTHQIRLQAGSRGHPVLGDALYGSTIGFGPETEDQRMRWIALHARSLQLQHPKTRETISVTAPLSPHWDPFGMTPP